MEFTSFSWKRLIASILFLSVGTLDLFIFQPFYGRHVPTGSIMTFQGPSYFVSAGLIPLLLGIGLLIYVILSYFNGEVIQDNGNITIIEKRWFIQDKTELKIKEISLIQLTNNEIGVKYLWLFLIIPYLIFNFYYMILNFNQPFITSLFNLTAVITLISIIGSFLGLIILFVFPQWYLEIYTYEGKYELWFEPFRDGRKKINEIVFSLNNSKNRQVPVDEILITNSMNRINLLIAIFFLSYGIFSITTFMTIIAVHQTLISHFLVIMGFYLLSREIRKTPLSEVNDINEREQYNIKSSYYQTFLLFKSDYAHQVRRTLEGFEVFWFICSSIIYIFIPFKIIQNFFLINPVNHNAFIGNFALDLIFGILVLFFLTIFLFKSSKKLILNGISYDVEIPITKQGQIAPISTNNNIKSLTNEKTSLAQFKKQYKRRICFIVSCLIISILLISWQYFFYFNLFNLFNL